MAGLQPDFYSAVAITLTAAVAALLLRLKARRMTKQPLWYDDWFAVVAFVSLKARVCIGVVSLILAHWVAKIFAVAYCTVVILGRPPFGYWYFSFTVDMQ